MSDDLTVQVLVYGLTADENLQLEGYLTDPLEVGSADVAEVTNRGSADVRSRSGCAGIVMWLDGSYVRLLSPLMGSLLSLSPPKRGLLHQVC